MSARQLVKDALAATELPITDGRLPDQITDPALALGVEQVEPAGVGRMRRWTLWLAVLTPLQSEGVDDDLEQTLAAVLDALDAARQLTWTTATRTAVKDDAYHAIVVNVSVTMQEV